MHEPNVREIEEDLGENIGPVLRSSKKKGEMSLRGQVEGVLEMCTLQNKMVFKARSKSMECCICLNSIVEMMVPHDCHVLLEKKSIVTKATSLVIRVLPCCNV